MFKMFNYLRSPIEKGAMVFVVFIIFVGVMAFAVKAVIEKVSSGDDLKEGDVYIFNDPYDGGTHLSDFRLVKPIFRDGAVFCYIASVGHWHDVGGNVPGNYNPEATESFQEGILVPPVKLFKEGTPKPMNRFPSSTK